MGAVQDLRRGGILMKLMQRGSLDGQRLEELGTQMQCGFKQLVSLGILLKLEVGEAQIIVDFRRLRIKSERLLKGLHRVAVMLKFTEEHSHGYELIDIIGPEG